MKSYENFYQLQQPPYVPQQSQYDTCIPTPYNWQGPSGTQTLKPPFGVQQHPYNIPMPYNLQGPSGTQNLSYTTTSHSEHQLLPTIPQVSSRSEISDSQPANQPPAARPMLAISSQGGNYLPSSAITQSSLKNFEDVLHKNYKLCTEASAGTLCQILAKEVFFGKEAMEQCTPNGARDCPGLPRLELNNLKAAMFRLFPRFHSCPELFEPLWKKCMVAMEQACRRLRLAKRTITN